MTEFIDIISDKEAALRFGWDKVPENSECPVIVEGSPERLKVATKKAGCDIICPDVSHKEGDFMHQKNSGMDTTIVRDAQKNGISVLFRFSDALDSYGKVRALVLSRMRQNVLLCEKAGCTMILTSGTQNSIGVRAPKELIAFGKIIGMDDSSAKSAISTNPAIALKRARERKDPNVVANGVVIMPKETLD